MLYYFLLVFSALVWMVFTFIMWHQGKTVDATASVVIMHIYIAATLIVGTIKSKE